MQVNSKHLIVQFDQDHNKVFKIAGVEIIRPDSWTLNDKGSQNFNLKDVHPQLATVVVSNPNSPYQKGDRIFLHYMAKETEEHIEIEDEHYSVINTDFVFFKIEDGQIIMADNFYLGEQVFTEAPQTASGIYLTPFDKKKETLHIRLLHIPQNIAKSVYGTVYKRPSEMVVGDEVITCDDNQYILTYEGKDYVKLLHDEILGKFTQEEV